MVDKLNVLFVCTGNTCRSQMAEGWARHLKNEQIRPFSAGVIPGRMDPLAVEVMAEVGVDISKQTVNGVYEFLTQELDVVVTVCDEANQQCPVFPARVRVVPHSFDDPPRLTRDMVSQEEKLAVYRRVRDEIRDYVETLPESLPAE